MFKNYQELVVSYTEFYSNQIYSDRSKFRSSPPDSFIDAATTISNKSTIEACFSLNNNSEQVSIVEVTECSPISAGCRTGNEQDPAGLIDSANTLSAISTRLDESGHENVIGSFNPLSLMDLFNIMTLFISFIYVKRYLSKSISTSVSTSRI